MASAAVIGLLLAILASSSQARQDGASNTSCYDHVILHTLFGQQIPSQNCTTNTRCSSLTLTPSCPEMQDDICCTDFDRRILYTNCNYTFQWSDGTNLGFLVQARINPDPTNMTFNPASTIVGRWDTGDNHQTLRCRDSRASNEEPVPNSVTHTRVYQETDLGAPTSINVTWWSDTTNPEDSSDSPVNITFFYTISRDISTNFLPYTTDELSFELRSSAQQSTTLTTVPPSPVTRITESSSTQTTTTDSGQNTRMNAFLICVLFLIATIFVMG